MLLEISAVFLLISDRRAYIFRGDPSDLGWFMVRLSNFLVFFLTLVVIYAFNLYLIDLYTHEAGLDKIPKRLKVVKIMVLAGMALVVISQFTGFYYTYDEMNRYQRAPGFIVCYVIPLSILVLQMSVIIQYYKRHPVYGNQILSSIQQSPYLSIGAHYHHERYDGRGYPEGLKGEDIPDIARMIAVADSYDAMTS